jgi:UDP-N-acetylmuramoyl-L-alanyl-D-glutamate--2,6-diaminopimelate ligase
MTLDELISRMSANNSHQGRDGPKVRIDSRLVEKGDIFVAIPGTVCDGHDFIDQAVANGAKYVVRQAATQYDIERSEIPMHIGIQHTTYETIVVDDTAKAAGLLAQTAAGNPADKLINLAVTGTNGKTTVAFLVRSIIQQACPAGACPQGTGPKCGLIGTVTYDTCLSPGGLPCSREATMTTPDCIAIARMTAEMVENGAECMVIEASSHALSQNRLAGVNFKAAAFTNLTGDHLDYHKTEEDYLAAKTILFAGLAPDAVAVLNKQSPHAKLIAEQTQANILWYAIDDQADITAHIKSMDTAGTAFTLEYAGQRQTVKTPLLGLYNVSNCLAATGLCLAAGFDLEAIARGLSALPTAGGIPGRLEKVDWPGDFTVLIDYAHTDDALKNVLATLKPLCKGRLITLFGCGGDRDRTKRPRMAKVAEEYSDLVVVTSDNPRTERPEKIIEEILTGFKQTTEDGRRTTDDRQQRTEDRRHPITVEVDREKAICLVIDMARKDDIVLIAGKGHENYQIIGTKKSHFSDKEIAQECLAEWRMENGELRMERDRKGS